MQGLIEFPDSPASWPKDCEVAKGGFQPFIDPKEAEGITMSCDNPFRQNIITCKDMFKQEFIQEVNGLALNSKLGTELDSSPAYVPQLDFLSCKEKPLPSTFPIVGLTLHDLVAQGILYKAGRYHEQEKISFRSHLLSANGFKDKKVILFLTGADTLIEWIWYNRVECQLFEVLKKMGFWAVTGFNFSVIGGECPFAQALNIKRSLFSTTLIEKNELLAIPHVYAITQYHIQRWIRWFIANPYVKLFTINCQLQKSDADIAQVITTTQSILEAVPYLHVLLQGFHFDKMESLGHLLERVHFADKVGVKFAQCQRRIQFDLAAGKLSDTEKTGLSLKELLEPNVINRYLFVEYMRNRFTGKIAKRA